MEGWVDLSTAVKVLKTVYRSSCRDKHYCQRRDSNLDPLTPQSDALTTRLLRPVKYVKSWENFTRTPYTVCTSPVICSHFTLRNPKKSFFNIIHILQLIYVPQKKTNSNCCTAALSVNLLLFSASYYLHSPSTASPWGTLQEERVYWYGHVVACGSGLLRHGLNSNTA